MGVCHGCRCFYCENLLSKKCPVKRVCSTCYKGINSRNYQIVNCDSNKPFAPLQNSDPAPKKQKKKKKEKVKRLISTHKKKRGG